MSISAVNSSPLPLPAPAAPVISASDANAVIAAAEMAKHLTATANAVAGNLGAPAGRLDVTV